MFRCQKCQNSSHRPNRVVTEYRMHEHPSAQGNGPRGGRGPQIVNEVTVCDECLPSMPAAVKPEVATAEETVAPLTARVEEAA